MSETDVRGFWGMANRFAVQNEGLRHGSPTGLQVHCKEEKGSEFVSLAPDIHKY